MIIINIYNLKMFRYLSKLFPKTPVKPVGRWLPESNKINQDIKITLANYDSCGDKLCGTPISLKKEIDDIIKKNKD